MRNKQKKMVSAIIKKSILLLLVILFLPSIAEAKDTVFHEKSIYQLDKTWLNRFGKTVKLESLMGNSVVIALGYTSCLSACPMMVAEMKGIQEKLSKKAQSQVKFVFVSIDPKKDSPKELEVFAKKHNLSKTSWILLTGDASNVLELAVALDIKYKQNIGGHYSHSIVANILDKKGVIFSKESLPFENKKEIKNKLEKLVDQTP